MPRVRAPRGPRQEAALRGWCPADLVAAREFPISTHRENSRGFSFSGWLGNFQETQPTRPPDAGQRLDARPQRRQPRHKEHKEDARHPLLVFCSFF